MELFVKMAADLPFNPHELRILIATAPNRYKTHFIDKRHGRGKREISQPTAEVKLLQRWIIENIFPLLPVHDAATAYRKKRGIANHAQPHVDANYLLKLDFKDFFPSILGTDFLGHLRRHIADISHVDAQRVVNVLFRKDKATGRLRLSIGAPSSPAVSNTILFEFDTRLEDACRALSVVYTRYADDLAFSTNIPRVLDDVLVIVNRICSDITYPRLILNEEKTVFTSRKHLRELTGLILTPDKKLSIGRERKRLIRAMVHNYGNDQITSEDTAKLRGLIAFCNSIEPSFLVSLERMVGSATLRKLLHPGK